MDQPGRFLDCSPPGSHSVRTASHLDRPFGDFTHGYGVQGDTQRNTQRYPDEDARAARPRGAGPKAGVYPGAPGALKIATVAVMGSAPERGTSGNFFPEVRSKSVV